MRPWFVCCLLWTCFGLVACSPNHDKLAETEEKAYLRGQRLLKEGRPADALESFVSVIAKRKVAPEAHLEAGQLYLNIEHDPVMAIYHFRQYLAQKPSSAQAPMVRQLIETARKAFAKEFPASPFAPDMDRLDLLEAMEAQRSELEILRKDNIILKERLASIDEVQALARVPINPFVEHKQPSATQPMQPKTAQAYIVQSGDTLSKISTKTYGTPVRWKEIYELNRDQLKSPHDLKLGQSLKLP